jgi:hypothetical protein
MNGKAIPASPTFKNVLNLIHERIRRRHAVVSHFQESQIDQLLTIRQTRDLRMHRHLMETEFPVFALRFRYSLITRETTERRVVILLGRSSVGHKSRPSPTKFNDSARRRRYSQWSFTESSSTPCGCRTTTTAVRVRRVAVRGTQDSNAVDKDNWNPRLFGGQKLGHPRWCRLMIHCDRWVTSH